MKTLFTADFFINNRARLREALTGTTPVVITANGQLQKSSDTIFPFQQDTNFWYLTGLNNPDIVLVLENKKEYLILPKRSEYQDTFDGSVDTKELTNRSGITDVYEYEEGWQQLSACLKKVSEVATVAPPPQYIDVFGMYTNPARWVLTRSLREKNDKIKIIDARNHITRLRMIKQPSEIEAIKAAIAVTVQGLKAITKPEKLQKYTYEYEVEADLTYEFHRQNSEHAFDPIIAGGERACILHNIGSKGIISSDELLLFDVGAAAEGYAADISRTIALQTPSKRQQQVHTAVKDVQSYAFSLLKPGVLLQDYEKQVEKYMGKKLRELGLIKTEDSEAIRAYYPHAASHHLGLDVHDVYERERPLEPNMVITVEPGIYIRDESIGVRIEDDVRITDDGIEILTDTLSSELR